VGFFSRCKKDKIVPLDNNTTNNELLRTPGDSLGEGYEEETIGEINETPEVVVVYLGTLPTQKDLPMPPAKHQGAQGSCTAWAVTYGLMSYLKFQAEGTPYFLGGAANNAVLCSPAYTFNQVKAADPDDDCGGSGPIQHLSKLKTQGVCTLAEMPYYAASCATLPNPSQIAAAGNNKISQYFRISRDNIPLLKAMLALDQPLTVAIKSNTALKNLSAPYVWSQGASGNGHSVVIRGYSDLSMGFKFINSWGQGWGDNGNFYMTYSNFQALPNGKQCYTAFWKSNPALNNLSLDLEAYYLLNGDMTAELGATGTQTDVTATTNRTGATGNAAFYNGTSSYSQGSYNLEDDGFSISCWIRPETSFAGEKVLFSQVTRNASPNLGIEILLHNDTLKLDMPIGTGRVRMGGNSKLIPGNWYHIAVTFNEKFVRLYVNGIPVEIGVCTEFFDSGDNTFNLGCRRGDNSGLRSNFFHGKIDDLRLYGRAINDAEVDELFAN
jgi:hypothetical protein